MDISFTVCFLVCTVTSTDFSGQGKARGAKFCMEVHRHPGQGIFNFGDLCSPRSPKSDESATHWEVNFRVREQLP